MKETGHVLNDLTKPFAWIGRHGTQGFALSIFVGLALPQFAAAARPLLAITIFIFVMLTFARAEETKVRALVASPKPLVLASLWLILAPAVVITAILTGIGRGNLDPGLVLGLAVMGAAPPIMSAPAIAMMLGLEPTLLLTAVLVTTGLAPVVSPVLVDSRVAQATNRKRDHPTARLQADSTPWASGQGSDIASVNRLPTR